MALDSEPSSRSARFTPGNLQAFFWKNAACDPECECSGSQRQYGMPS